MQNMSKHQLEALQHNVRLELRRRYKHSQAPKYGSLDKAFSDQELQILLAHVTNRTAKTVLQVMVGLGLRIGEAVSLRTKDVDLAGRRLWVSKTEKGSVPTMFFLHDQVLEVLRQHLAAGRANKEWIFPAVHEHNHYPHISPHWVSKEFREARARAGLDFSYGWSEETRPGRNPRPLYRLVTHSCRHYFGHKVFEGTKDILVTQRLMRHASINSTQRYMHKRQEELDRAMMTVFS